MSVDEKHGISMTSGLRTPLRMDPDILFIGEIRDEEAAAIATRAACSGAFVFSSLHARDVASTITVLRELNIKPRSLASSLAGIINQRLVRRICTHCRKPKSLSEKHALMFSDFGLAVPEYAYESEGCDACRGSGFFGRCGIFEVIHCDCASELSEAIGAGATEPELRRIMKEQRVISLGQDALIKVQNGVTSLEEAFSVSWL